MSNRITDAIGRCNPEEPLQPGDPRWHDFDAVRGAQLHERIARRMAGAESEQKYCHLALAGHRGSGKSTELNRVAAAKTLGYLPLHAYVNDAADPNDLSFGDLFLLMLRMLADGMAEERLPALSSDAVERVRAWFRQITVSEESEREGALEATLGGGIDTSTAWSPFIKLIAGLTATLKANSKRRREVRESVEQYPDVLLEEINLLLDDARRAMAVQYPRGPLFILDNLDRYAPEQIDSAVLRQADLYNGIQSHVIFVVPISLLYNPPGETVEDRFQIDTLPMIPVFQRQPDHAANATTLAELAHAIHKRVDPSFFAASTLVQEMARVSGGCPRDLLRLLQEALLETRGDRIDERSLRAATNRVRGEFARKLTYDQYALLARVHLDGRIDPDATGRQLLFRRAALEYFDEEGERWVGVHPLLWSTAEFTAALQAELRRRQEAPQ